MTTATRDSTVTVPLRVELTRDMAASAVDQVSAMRNESPAIWSPALVRESVEMYVGIVGTLRLEEEAPYFATVGDGSAEDYRAVVYDAVDRSYPELCTRF